MREVKHPRRAARIATRCDARRANAIGRENPWFVRVFCMHALPDGTYDVIVVDADAMDDNTVRIELTVTAGEHIGAIVAVRASRVDDDPVMLLGLPGTLRVEGGTPHFDVER